MKIAIRTDASLQIGTGHVMRCLTLADAITAKGAECHFICREHAGNLIEHVRSKGYATHSLPMLDVADTKLAHSHWLGSTQAQDAEACAPILSKLQPDWLVVDHYALDAQWERLLAPHYRDLMVIDDLADRAHECRVLLDQTFGRAADDYRAWVPSDCKLLCGSTYALLRPEFAELREYSLQRRTTTQLKHLFINMGGVDKDNVTSKVLDALHQSPLPSDCEITVIMGTTSPWLAEVEERATAMLWHVTVRAGVDRMAQMMADSDLAIGAAGATSWERCCLGLPTILLVLAENQTPAAENLQRAGAAIVVDSNAPLDIQLKAAFEALKTSREANIRLVSNSARITDGLGATRTVSYLVGHS
jgi:UDP-2,4-diacetamido-2,4,6-trideoxy-beta-L-altropyranose hydrolase